ncbi:MAG: AMP-binding protein [Marinovum sp.]|nr:AMP-binding protein [Marinovum sp.]
MTIIKLLRAHSRALPNKPALIDADRMLTYAELNARSDALAEFVINRAPTSDAVIGCVKTSMTTTLVVGLGCLKAGHPFAILDARDSQTRVQNVFETAECKLIVVDSQQAADAVAKIDATICALDDIPHSRITNLPVPAGNTLSYIEPTSGSTGTPKLVPIDHDTLNHYIAAQVALGDINGDDTVALLGEMWFDTLLSGLWVGATLAAYDLRGLGAATAPEWLRNTKVSVIQTFVAAFRAIADAASEPFPDLRLVKLAGENVLPTDVIAFERICHAGSQLINYYGSTECSLITAYTHDHGAPRPAGSGLPVGRAIPEAEVELLTAEGETVEPGTIGRLIAKAQHMSQGYLNAPELSKDVYNSEPDGKRSLNTGDLARYDMNGHLVIVGRVDDQVKIRGYSVRYSEIETVLSTLSELHNVAVTSVLSPHGTRQLVAHFTAAEGQTPKTDEIRAALAAELPAYMVPSYLIQHDDLPRTDTGKILKRALPSPFDEVAANTPPLVAATQTEAQVAAIWTEVLGHRAFTRTDDFFDIGGESLQAMAVVIRIERHFPVRIGYESLIMRGATIADIAQRIDEALVMEKAPQTLLLKEGGDKTPLYLLPVENGEFSDWLYMLNAASPTRNFIGLHARDITQRSHFPKLTAQDLGRTAAQTMIDQNPDGPYVLAGFSAGAQLAIETARALQARNRNVAGLILLDPMIVEQEPLYRSWHYRRILSPLLKRGALTTTLNRAGHIWFGRAAHELDVADEAIFWSYIPEPLSGIPVLLGCAMDGKDDQEAYRHYWRQKLGANVEMWDLPGYHNRILRDPFAAPLAARLEAWLTSRFDEKQSSQKGNEEGHFLVADQAVAS